MSGKIDYHSSVTKKRIVYDRSFWSAIGELIDYFPVVFPFFFIGTITLVKSIMSKTLTMEEAVWSVLGILTSLFIFYKIRKINRLTAITGVDVKTNRQLVNTIAKNSDWESRYNNSKFAIFTLPDSPLSLDWGREMTIIYNGNDVLINCACFGMRRIKSPFHWIAAKNIEKRFIREFIASSKLEYRIDPYD